MANTKYTRIHRNWYCFIVLITICAGLSISAIAEELHLLGHIPPGDFAKSPLAGKAQIYTYHEGIAVNRATEEDYQAVGFGETIELVFEEGAGTYTGLHGKYKGVTERAACGQREIAPGIYFATWLESDGQVVTMVINTHARTVTTSFLDKTKSGKDMLIMLRAKIFEFGSIEEIKAITADEEKVKAYMTDELEALQLRKGE